MPRALPALAADALANVVRVEDAGRAMNGADCSDDRWDAWSGEIDAAYARIEALPLDPEFAAVRARAVMEIVDRELSWCLDRPDAPLTRLILQTIQSLSGRCAR
jgi:hypothetical protein